MWYINLCTINMPGARNSLSRISALGVDGGARVPSLSP